MRVVLQGGGGTSLPGMAKSIIYMHTPKYDNSETQVLQCRHITLQQLACMQFPRAVTVSGEPFDSSNTDQHSELQYAQFDY